MEHVLEYGTKDYDLRDVEILLSSYKNDAKYKIGNMSAVLRKILSQNNLSVGERLRLQKINHKVEQAYTFICNTCEI